PALYGARPGGWFEHAVHDCDDHEADEPDQHPLPPVPAAWTWGAAAHRWRRWLIRCLGGYSTRWLLRCLGGCSTRRLIRCRCSSSTRWLLRCRWRQGFIVDYLQRFVLLC